MDSASVECLATVRSVPQFASGYVFVFWEVLRLQCWRLCLRRKLAQLEIYHGFDRNSHNLLVDGTRAVVSVAIDGRVAL